MDLLKIKNAVDDLFYGDKENFAPITCELADEEIEGQILHHCFACNMATSLWTLKKLSDTVSSFQTGVKPVASKDDIPSTLNNEEIYRIFLPQIYLISEEIIAIFLGSGKDLNWIYENVPFISRIRKLMNFLKHPKSKGFFQHPQYIFIDNSQELKPWDSTNFSEIFTTIGSTIFNQFQLEEKLKFADCEGKFFRSMQLLEKQDLKDRYLQEIDSHKECFCGEPLYGGKDNDISDVKYYELKGAQKSLIYFCEADIIEYYSVRENHIKVEKLKKFCYLDNLVIILPTISSLLVELKHMLEYAVTYYKENPRLLGEISQFALTWESGE